MKPFPLVPEFHAKVWGSRRLGPWFEQPADPGSRIGEVWCTADGNRTPEGTSLRELCERLGSEVLGSKVRLEAGGRFPILVKFLFTTEKLSVQVHPDDQAAMAAAGSPGKSEMWYVLGAEPGAEIAAGFRAACGQQEVRSALAKGTLEDLIEWFPAAEGDVFFIPARTVHAIGAGVALCEIQQNSDITYRLYDYGRPREVHVEASLAVADFTPHPGKSTPRRISGSLERLAECRYFVTEKLRLDGEFAYLGDPERFHLLIPLTGSGSIGGGQFRPGECWLVPASAGEFRIHARGQSVFLRTFVPGTAPAC
jgi:mannose-6-phosphate isomerase